MRAWRIGNDIVAARNVIEAMRVWLDDPDAKTRADGPAEELDPEQLTIQIENEDGSFRSGKLTECMPGDGEAAQVVAYGECDCP